MKSQGTQEAFSRTNSFDLVSYAKMLHPDVEGFFAPLGIPMERTSFVAAVELCIIGFPDLHGEIVRSVDMGDGWVVLETVFTGTNDGPFVGPATGRSVTLECRFLMRSDAEGLLTDVRDYYDRMTLLEQLGLVPEPEPSAVYPASWGQIKATFQD